MTTTVDTFNTRRQLTPVQQTHILSDVQQHQQHRFSFPQNQVVDNQQKNFGQKPPNVFIEPTVIQQLPTQTSILNQRPPPFQPNQPQYRFPQSTVRLNPQQSQNNFRTAPAPNGRSNNFNNEIHVQHHTQTNFIPNFSQQQSTVEQTRSSNVQFPQTTFERSQNQAPQPHQLPNPQLHQQPLNQRSIPNGQNNFHIPQKPFQPSIQLPSPSEPLLPTPNTQQQVFSQQNPLPVQPVSTLQSQLFNPQPQFSYNPEPQTQILQIQPSKQIPNQFIQNHQPQQQFSTFPQQQQQTFVQPPPVQFIQPQPQFVQQTPQYFREEDRIKQIRDKQQIIQKHEQFVAKQYQKQLNKVKQQHEEFLAKQRQIKEQSITKNRPTNVEYSQQITRSRAVHPYESGTFERAVKVYHETHPTSPKPTTTTTSTTSGASVKKRKQAKGEISDEELEEFLKNHRQKLYSELKQEVESGKSAKGGKSKVKSTKALGRDDLLKQLKLALADAPQDLVIRTSDPSLIQGATPLDGGNEFLGQPERLVSASTTPQPDVINHEELLKGFSLPPGANFEVVKQGSDGALQPVGNVPTQKKVTFVYLEEQNDGSYKVQGVKANGDKEAKTKGAEVDSIVKRIKNGEIQLPPPSNRAGLSTIAVTSTTSSPNSPVHVIPLSTVYETNTATYSSSPSSTPSPTVHFGSSVSPYSTLATINSEETIRLTASPSSHFPSSTPSTLSTFQSTFASSPGSSSSFASSASTFDASVSPAINSSHKQTGTNNNNEFSSILKNNGLHAMAKYLKQSGLDSILNETGPYTVFVPTDKAFKSLLVQLGGPERAEEKFKTNPRLLSGLLLHHVIPGSFEIASLQDEMTGVSLAGTQLRVNQYNMHDAEWNDIKITTINGAMIVPDKNDITIPQGIAHAVDRVMFPLPVGDILQTLQSDREHRFTIFLKALFSSGISEILQNKDLGAKTYSVFAPIDAAFSNQTQDEINIMVNDKETATKLVMKHITPGTLFSAGMRFYQVKDSLTGGKPITLQKTSGGKIKVNESQIITSNIPATNGVIHAIDTLL
ncbi:hypothetical protein HA402_014839 [Bradysia odoriphaga]|nr:hypothetical protein HA402_014839 [Bradysia odoriphaga]